MGLRPTEDRMRSSRWMQGSIVSSPRYHHQMGLSSHVRAVVKEALMPVKIGSFEPLSEEEFHALRQQKTRKTDPVMVALLAEIEAGQPVRVPLVDGQSARGLRTAISRAASSRGPSVETVEGDGFVAVRRIDAPRARKQT